MKRITDEEIRSAYNQLKMKSPNYIPEIDRMVADVQLQADLKALEDSREKITDYLSCVLRKTSKGEFKGSFEVADQIIKLIKGEE